MKKIILIAGGVFIFMILIGISSDSGSNNNQPSISGNSVGTSPVSTSQKSANKYSTAVYFNQVINVYEDVTNSFQSLKLLESYRRYWTNADVIEAAKYTVIIEKSYEKVNNIIPPKDLIAVHQEVLQAFELFRDAMPIYRTAIDKDSTQIYNQSMSMLSTAVDRLDKVVGQFK